MRCRTLLILCLVAFSCRKDLYKSDVYSITITGTVRDQVTGHPVGGASVFIAYPMGGKELMDPNPTDSTLTGTDGKYQLKAVAKPYITDPNSPGKVSPGQYFLRRIVFWANNAGYMGSDVAQIAYYGAKNSVIDLQLYHSGNLNLHVKNDTTNNIDTVNILLERINSINPMYSVTMPLIWDSKKLDSTYILKNLFGNKRYSISVLKPSGEPFTPAIEFYFTPLPDTTTYFDISF